MWVIRILKAAALAAVISIATANLAKLGTSMISNVNRKTEISYDLQGALILHIRNLPLRVAEVKDRSENGPSKTLVGGTVFHRSGSKPV